MTAAEKSHLAGWGRTLVLVLISGVCLTSCRTVANRGTGPTRSAVPQIRFFLVSDEPGAPDVVLPESGVRIPRSAQPLLTAADIASVERAHLELGDGVVFQLNDRGTRTLADAAEHNPRRRLVLVVNDAALGVYRFDGTVPDGRLHLFVEVADAELPQLVTNLKSSVSSPPREWRVAQ